MDIADLINFKGLSDMPVPDDTRPVIAALLQRLELFKLNLIHQLRVIDVAEGTYTDAEAVTAMGALAAGNPLNHVRYTDAEAAAAIAGLYSLLTHRHDLEVLEHDGVNSNGGAFPFNTTGAITFNQNLAFTAAQTVDGVDVSAHAANVDAHHAQVHKDTHDPQTGTDPVDCAAAGEIVGVVAAAEGNADTLARSNHVHQIQHSIANNHIITIDDAGPLAATDYARFTANGLEGRTPATVLADLSGQAAADFDMNTHDLVNVGNVTITNDLTVGGGVTIAGTAGATVVGWFTGGILTGTPTTKQVQDLAPTDSVLVQEVLTGTLTTKQVQDLAPTDTIMVV